MAVVCTLGMLASIPGQTMGVGVFTDDLMAALRLTREQLSQAYAVGTLGSALLLPHAGRWVDRWGTRPMVVLAAVGLSVSLVGFTFCEKWAALWGSGWSAGLVTAAVGFWLIRFFGQGMLTLVSRVALSKWFNHRRGLVMALSGVATTFGYSSAPTLLNQLVQAVGWQGAYLVLAAAVGLGMSAVGWVFFRETPEQCGLVMDGVTDEAWRRKMAARAPEVSREFTRGEALRTRAFWVFNLALALQIMMMTSVTFHITSLGGEAGLDRAHALAVFLPAAAFSVTGNCLGGWISDRVQLKWVLLAMLVFQSVALAGLLHFGQRWGYGLFLSGYGASAGLFTPLLGVTWPRFFGRAHLGAISGANMSTMVLASALGPVLFSTGHRLGGSYAGAIYLCLAAAAVLMVPTLTAENPQQRPCAVEK